MENNKSFDTLDIFVYLWKKRKPIIIVTVAGAVISVIVSLLLTNYYKATTVLFPTTFVSPSTSIIRQINQETDPLIIGDEDDLERLIQLLKSDYITDKMIKKYDLINHYRIKADDPNVITKVKKTYNSNVSFNKTQYQGVTVSVVDEDPEIAANMANDIAQYLDTLVFKMQKQRSIEALEIAKNIYKEEVKHLKKLEDSLDIYRQLGVLDYFREVDRYSEAYGKAIGNNTLTNKGEKIFEEKFDLFQKYGKKFFSLTDMIRKVQGKVSGLHLTLITIEQNLKKPMTHKFVISYAQPPDKKAKPKRSFIVIFSTIGAFIFSIAIILFLDFIKEFRKRIKSEK